MAEETTPVHARIALSTKVIAQSHARRMHISDAAYYRLAIETLNGIQSAKTKVAGPEILEDATPVDLAPRASRIYGA